MEKKRIGLTLCGKRYEINLDASFADFIERDLREAGIDFNIDNRPEALLKAYLRLAKQTETIESDIERILRTLE